MLGGKPRTADKRQHRAPGDNTERGAGIGLRANTWQGTATMACTDGIGWHVRIVEMGVTSEAFGRQG